MGLSADDIREMKPLSKADADKLERLIEHQIPDLRREAQPTFNK